MLAALLRYSLLLRGLPTAVMRMSWFACAKIQHSTPSPLQGVSRVQQEAA